MKNLKRFLASLMVVIMVLTATPLSGFVGLELPNIFDIFASAESYSGTCGDNLTWSLDTSTGELVISGTGVMNNYSKTYINGSYRTTAPWSSYISSIKKVTIGDGATSIGSSAFYGCTSLTSITIPDSVTNIGSSAFRDCTSLTSITIPDSVTSIGSSVFYNCKNLTSITIPDSVTSIGSSAFSYCDSLTSITIPDSVTSIGSSAFYYCESLASITIGDGVTSIGSSAFRECTSLTSITIPDSVTSIGSSAFYNTGYYNNSSNWEKNVLYIGNHLIEANTSISGAYTIKMGTIYVANSAFYYCSSLTSITIPDSVTSIGSSAFEGCTSLTSITIPDGVTSISDDAFFNCTSLTSITIPDSVTRIGSYAFYGCTSLTSITIPDSVTSIGDQAFYSCESLTNITIPDSVTSIGYDAFDNTGYYNDSSNWEDDVLYIGNHLIEAKRDITGSYKVKAGTKTIGSRAFYLCDSIISVTIPESVTTIGYDSLYRGGLRTIYYEGDIADWCSVIIENPYAIYNGNTDLYINGKLVAGDIVIPDGVTSIGQYAFAYRENITSITIPDSVTDIGNEVFRACYELSSVTVPSSLEKVGNILFYNCRQPITVYFDGTEYEWSRGEYSEWFSEASEIIYMIQHGDEKDVHSVISETPVTCTTAGKKTYLCRCGETYTEDIPALGHNPEYFKVDSTCKEAGYECYKCTNCGTEYMREELDIIDHISGDWETVETATCSEDGYKIKKCTMCGEETHRETIPATGHSYEESIITEPTCEGVGTKRFTCSVCGDSYDEEIAANGHKIKVIRKEPTCTSIGNEQYLCETCGNMIGDMVFLPKLPHAYGEWTVTDPTATEDGSKVHSCTACGKTEAVTIPALGFETADGVTVDLEKNTISGFNAGVSSLDSYTTIVNENYVWEYEAANGKLGTGSKAILKDGDTVIGEYTILVYGDTTGDSWYDGQDAIIVDCLANGMLTKDDVGEAVYMAADCNHDGVIDQLDVDLLNEAGTLLANVDQTKPTEVLLETSSEYVEYLDLIDQSPEIEDEPESPEADVETEDTIPGQDAKVDVFGMIMNFIRYIIEMILSRIPVPYR